VLIGWQDLSHEGWAQMWSWPWSLAVAIVMLRKVLVEDDLERGEPVKIAPFSRTLPIYSTTLCDRGGY